MRKIYDYNEEQYTKDTPEFMYFLGLVASDGVLERYHIKITLQSADSGLLESLRDSIVPKKPLYYVKRDDTYVLKISNKKITSTVRSYGITEKKSLTLSLSNAILNSPNFNHFLRGLFDGDGTITQSGPRDRKRPSVKIVSGSRQMLEDVATKLSDLGMNRNKVIASKTKQAYNYNPGSEYYTLQYTCGQTKKFFNIIYENKNFYMKRKYNKFLEKFANLG